MFHLFQMTVIESANLYLLIETLRRENCFIPTDIISRLAVLNSLLANEKNIKIDGDFIHLTRTEIKNIYKQFFYYFSVVVRDKKIELKKRGRTESYVLLNESAISNIYEELNKEIIVNEEVLSELDMPRDENNEMLDRYHEAISFQLSNLQHIVLGFQQIHTTTYEWNASELRSYLNWEDAIFLKRLIQIFCKLDLGKDKIDYFIQTYDNIIKSTQVKKQSLFANLFEEMMVVFLSKSKDVLLEKKKRISVLSSELHCARDRFKHIDRQAALDLPREDFSTTVWSEMIQMSFFFKASFKSLVLVLSPGFACGLSIAQREFQENLNALTTLDYASIEPILNRYKSYQYDIFDLFRNKILNDTLLSDNDYKLVANKIAEFLALLSPRRVPVGFFADGLGPKNEKFYEGVPLKSPVPNRKINNSFFLGEVKAKDNVEAFLDSSINRPANNKGK